MSITMRVSETEKKVIQQFADLCGMSVSEYIRKAVLERIEDEYDLKCYEEAKADFEDNPETCTTEELAKELGIKL